MGRKKDSQRAAKKLHSRLSQIGLPENHPMTMFKPLAELITPDPPEWLVRLLWEWTSTIFMSAAVDLQQPTRVEMADRLRQVKHAARVLRFKVGNVALREFLDAAGEAPISYLGQFQQMMMDIEARATHAALLPSLVDKSNRAKPGPGPARPAGAVSPKTYCALFIAEVCKWFRGSYPPPRNRQAAELLDRYWKLSRGERASWGNDPLGAWRHHFSEAAKISDDHQDRVQIRQYMGNAAAHEEQMTSEQNRGAGKQSPL